MTHIDKQCRKSSPLLTLHADLKRTPISVDDDSNASLDPMPPAVQLYPGGGIVDRHTTFTEVNQETTDDN